MMYPVLKAADVLGGSGNKKEILDRVIDSDPPVRIYTKGVRDTHHALRVGVTDSNREEVHGCSDGPVGRLGVWW